MIDDRNPHFGRGFRISSAQLADLKRKWGELGRRVFDESIRTGRNVLARTEAEIEALGRAELERARLEQTQARAVRSAIKSGADHGLAVARDTGEGVRAHIADHGRREVDEAERKRQDGLAVLGLPEAAGPLVRNRGDMVDAGWVGADKYFHCKGNCEAAQRGQASEEAAVRLGNARELYGTYVKGDPRSDSAADQAANRFGRSQGRTQPGASCSALCSGYRPRGLPSSY